MTADTVTTYSALQLVKCPRCGRSISRVSPGTLIEARLAPPVIELARPGSTIITCKKCHSLVELRPVLATPAAA